MTDVNEEIVRTYFQLKGYLTYPNLKYMIRYEKSAGESDIDLPEGLKNQAASQIP